MEKSICERAKISSHNRYKCHCCGRKIKDGLPLLRKSDTAGKFGYQTHSYCYKCAELAIAGDKKSVEEMDATQKAVEAEFNKLKEECAKALVLDKITEKENEGVHYPFYR